MACCEYKAGMFRSSVIRWFYFAETEEAILRRIEDAFYSNQAFAEKTITFRTGEYMGAGQAVARWDKVHPTLVFRRGFYPAFVPEEMDYLKKEVIDLDACVKEKGKTVYVDTVLYASEEKRWKPKDINGYFEYEIYAPGGIDVNATFGENAHKERSEVLFAGGIRAEYVRSAREYDKSGKLLRVWLNTTFKIEKIEVLGANVPKIPEFKKPSCDIIPWAPTGLKSGKGERGVVRCAMSHPKVDNVWYFFSGEQYAICAFENGDFEAGAFKDRLVKGPRSIVEDWPSLRQCCFHTVDSVLIHPTEKDKAYFFCGEWCALIKIDGPDEVIDGPRPIGYFWAALPKAGFRAVDACEMVPDSTTKVLFSYGTKWCCESIPADDASGVSHDLTDWKSLVELKFKTLETCFAYPCSPTDAFYFCGADYSCSRIEEGTMKDSIIRGPRKIKEDFESLRLCKFY